MGKIINGIDIQIFKSGWWGNNNEGADALESVGLPPDKVPFDVEKLLNGEDCYILTSDAEIHISVNKQDNCFEFVRKHLGKSKSFRLYREWDGVNIDAIIELESYSVGECVRQILINKNIL